MTKLDDEAAGGTTAPVPGAAPVALFTDGRADNTGCAPAAAADSDADECDGGIDGRGAPVCARRGVCCTNISTRAAWTSLAMCAPSPQTYRWAERFSRSSAISPPCSRKCCCTYTF